MFGARMSKNNNIFDTLVKELKEWLDQQLKKGDKAEASENQNTADSLELSFTSCDDLNSYFYHSEKNAVLYKEEFEKSRELTLNDFKILSILGRGAFGKVFLVFNVRDRKYYAMK